MAVSFAAGGIVSGAFCMLWRTSSVSHDDYLSAISSQIYTTIRTLDRLENDDLAGAQFLLDMNLDGNLITLYYREKQKSLNALHRTAMIAAVQYRQEHPFTRIHRGVDRGEDMEFTIREILESHTTNPPGASIK